MKKKAAPKTKKVSKKALIKGGAIKKKPAAPKVKKVTKKALIKQPPKYRTELDKYDLRARIPATITDDILIKCCRANLDNSMYVCAWGYEGKHYLNDKTDPKAFFRRAIGAMFLSSLDDFDYKNEDKFPNWELVDCGFCSKKDVKLFRTMVNSLPKNWNSHTLIDLHWGFLKEGEKNNPKLYEIVDKYLADEMNCSND